MRKLITAGVLAGLLAAGTASGYLLHGQARTTGAAVCTFDGGGTLTAGNAARTTDGREWLCTDDGRLVRIG